MKSPSVLCLITSIRLFSLFLFQCLAGFFPTVPAGGFPSPVPDTPLSSIMVENIMEDIRHLSHSQYQGRQTGTAGGVLTANFIAERFQTLGLQPGHRSTQSDQAMTWFQEQPITSIHLREPARITLSLLGRHSEYLTFPLTPGQDFLPVLDSPTTNITGKVVFVGYGIVDPARGVDEYQGSDVQNRIVLFLRGKPAAYPRWVTHEEKAAAAKARGAIGYLTVTGPVLNPYEARKGLGQRPLAIYAASPDDRPIPGAWISAENLDHMLHASGVSLKSLQENADQPGNFRSMPLPLLAHFQWESRILAGKLINVLGFLPGNDPGRREEIVVIGAHHDHFGEQADLMFPGADDNASGTAVLLELARILAQRAEGLPRSLLFVSFDGEERGLLGSTLYIKDPAFPLGQTIAMINLDHLGVGNGNLTVGATSKTDTAMLRQAAEETGLGERVQLYGFFPGGDHVPFYEAGIPTITVVSSGPHPNFHQITDTAETIEPDIPLTAGELLLAFIWHLANRP
jgi:hypothetical protein